jgi:hypothetical protein
MSKELQDKADVVMRELKELLVPISSEIKNRQYTDCNTMRMLKKP